MSEFLFDQVPEGVDVDHPDDRAGLLALDGDGALIKARSAMRAMVAEQIVGGDPPAVWATAQRLLDLGIDRGAAMTQLAMALASAFQATLARGNDDLDADAYEAALGSLPLPTAPDIEAAILTVVAAGSPLPAEDLEARTLALLGRAESDALAMTLVERLADQLMDDDGPIALLAGDLVVNVDGITTEIVLTHRLSGAEHDLDTLYVGFDLAGFARRRRPHLADGAEFVVVDAETGGVAWQGPVDWLAPFQPGALLAVRVDIAGAVSIWPLPDEPPVDTHLVEVVRSVYDDEVAEPWLPVSGEDLILGTLVRDGRAFDRPCAPLEHLCAAAGLEVHGVHAAHDASVWAAQLQVWQMHRVMDALGAGDQSTAALRVLELVQRDDPAREDLRQALEDLRDIEVAEVVVAELQTDGSAETLAAALLSAATTARQIGLARWVGALAAEAAGDVRLAETHLHAGLEADASSVRLIERCAWYASDRGQAQEAQRLWHRLDASRSADIRTVEPFARRSGPKLGRNDPCWCGSGRKYKTCHAGQAQPIPLPERVGWLCRKATAYLEHGGPEARDLVMALAYARAAGLDKDSLVDALEDPIVIDAALTEGGWFGRFVDDRSDLLPDDEALLAQTWTLVPRTVYETINVTPGVGLRVRDLRTGDLLDVRERTLSLDLQPRTFLCGRAVPDGESQQFVGGLFPVAAGTEAAVLELCDEGDPEAICEYAGSLHRPPLLHTREGEPIVTCTAVLELPDPASAAMILDRHYRRDGDEWVELFAMGEHDDILRATLTLDGSRLQIDTHSEPRLHRVLALLGEEMPGARLVSDDRTPLDPGELPAAPSAFHGTAHVGPEALREIQDLLEQRWIGESVPALGGLTPRQAADDPTRRDQLRRLIASFPEAGALPEGAVTMRPARLCELLGL